jgi:hypothetical protein
MATYAIDTAQTFTACMLMATGPRLKFGSSEQDVSAAGEKKWEVQAAVSFIPEYGMKAQSDILSVTVTGTDPGQGINPGSPIELVNLRVGIVAPEKADNGKVRGGKPYWQASGIRVVNGHRPPAKAE